MDDMIFLKMQQTSNSRLTRRRKVVAWLGIMALFMPILTSVAQGIPLSGMSDNMPMPSYIVLCKAMQKGTSGPSPEQIPDTSDCTVCIGFFFAKSASLTPMTETPACDGYTHRFDITKDNRTADGRLVSRLHARAPPLSV
jgi:hypothetical protein